MSDRTARHRRRMSAPVNWLLNAGLFRNVRRALDYGCGHGTDAKILRIDAWDPHHRPGWTPKRVYYDLVLCTYVLNVIPSKEERRRVLADIRGLLKFNGVAYVTVRRDIKGWRYTRNGWQGNVQVPGGRSIHRTSWYETYEISVPAPERRRR